MAEVEDLEQYLAPAELRYLVIALAREWERAMMAAIADPQLTYAQIEILLTLDELGPCSMQELSESLLLNRDPFRAVESLVKQGFLIAQKDSDDRRKVSWSLTDAGIEVVAQIIAVERQLLIGYLKGFTDADTGTLIKLTRQFLHNVNDHLLDNRFGMQRSPIGSLMRSEPQHQDTKAITERIKVIIELKFGGDLRAAYEYLSTNLAQYGISISSKAWEHLASSGRSGSDDVLALISQELAGDAQYLLTTDLTHVAKVESTLRAYRALSVAGVTNISGRGVMDSEALVALAKLIQERGDNQG